MAGLHEDNNNLKLSLSKVEAERKQVQERSNNLEKVSRLATSHPPHVIGLLGEPLWDVTVQGIKVLVGVQM